MAVFRLAYRAYKSKGEAQGHIQRMLHGEEPIDHEILLALLKLHPNADRKIGCGVKRFFTRLHPEFRRSPTWWLERHDGTETDWSYRQCFNPVPAGQKVLAVLREAVREQIVNYLSEYKAGYLRRDGYLESEFSGVLFPTDECEVNHVVPFSQLVADFLRGYDAPMSIPLESNDGCIGPDTRPYEHLMSTFAAYHAEYAILCVMGRAEHVEATKEQKRSGLLVNIGDVITDILGLVKPENEDENARKREEGRG